MPVDLELWNKLSDFQLDDPRAAYRFTARLAHENGWSDTFAKRAIGEYKRFVYLAATSMAPVTPSDVVDQVWHLHLTFTRSYWDDMCHGVLGHPLHHGPTKGGANEDAKYRNQYAGTLALYRVEFGTEPPLEFWPPEEDRFAAAPHQRWIDTRTHIVLRRPKLRTLWASGALALTGAATATGTAAADTGSDADKTAAYVMLGGVAAAAALLFAALFPAGAKRNGRKNREGKNNGCAAIVGGTSAGGEGGEAGGGGDGGGGGGGCGGD